MIEITIVRRYSDSAVTAFKVIGHANFADYGNDIVCAGVSAVTFGTVNAVEKLTGYEPEVEMQDSGWFAVRISESQADNWPNTQLILESMVVMLETIEDSYSEHVKITTLQEGG